jgi:hypothetical protein
MNSEGVLGMTGRFKAWHVLLVSASLLLVIPCIVFFVALSKGMSLADTGIALSEQFMAERNNLAVVSLLGLFLAEFLARPQLSWLSAWARVHHRSGHVCACRHAGRHPRSLVKLEESEIGMGMQ